MDFVEICAHQTVKFMPQGRRARREAEVHSLLDKLQPELIVLDPSTIGQVPQL